MSTSTTIRPTFSWKYAVFLAALVAHIPVGMEYSRRMWRAGHYQFFPLLMIVVAWLIYDRVQNAKVVNQESQTSNVLLGLNLATLVIATLFYSPFLWILSLLFLIASFIYTIWGTEGLFSALPAWLLLLFVVPLPKNFDTYLINQMQFLSSQLASWLLDAFGQIHFREGVVLITEKKQFFTEEACSGVRSLFSSLAAISIFGVMNRYPLWRHLFNLSQTMIWVIVGNALRVAIVVYVSDNWTEEIATGTTHEMLGLVVFVFIFLLALSTDRGLSAWVSARENKSDRNVHGEVEEAVVDGKAKVIKKPQPVAQPAAEDASSKSLTVGQWVLIGFFALFTLFAAKLTYNNLGGDFKSFDNLPLLAAEDMPAQVGGWQQSDFKHEIREAGGLLAPESFVWTYRNQKGQKLTMSLDSPYYYFHNLKSCYSGLGWKVNWDHRYKIVKPDALDLTFLKMSKKQEHGICIFSAFDRNAETVIPPALVDWKMELMQNLTLKGNTRMLPVSQFQLLFTSLEPIEDTEGLQNLFLEGRELIKKTKRFQAN